MYYKINMYIFLIAIFLDYIDSSKFIKTSAHVVCSVVSVIDLGPSVFSIKILSNW